MHGHIDETTAKAIDLVHRGVRLMNDVLSKVSNLRTQPVYAEEIILGTVSDRLRGIPFEELDRTRAEIAKHLAKHGCCAVKAFGDDYKLSEVALQMESAAEQLAPYRKALEGKR